MTDRYAVIGNPIAHSKSPEIHAAFARATGEDLEYARILAPLDGFAAAVAAFRAAGGRGLNVTLPFKGEACRLATELSDRARAVEAVNTLRFEGMRILGDTTDGVGLVRDIGALGVAIEGRRVLLVGAGGASRSVIPALLDARPAALVVVNRTLERASELERQFGGQVQAVGFATLPRRPFDIVINATSAGHAGELPPLERSTVRTRRARLRHDLRQGRGRVPGACARGRRGARRRRTGHAGRTGGRIVLHLARRASGDRAGARDAPRRGVRRFVKALAVVLGALVLAVVLVQAWFLAHVLWWDRYNPGTTSVMAARLDGLQAKNPKAELKHRWVDYDRISAHLKRAVISAEDAKFIDHEGFDWEGIQRALEKNQRRGKVVAGGSTISQQLAKNLLLSGERSYLRKGQEAVVTVMIEGVMSKRRILEIYLNVAEWGEGVFGAEAAARHYFGVSAANLSPEQAARLAAMLPRPRFYDRNRGSKYLATYSERILARMPSAQVP